MAKVFAKEYSRTSEGWIEFPSDAGYRKELFPLKVNKHTAKANVFLIQSIIEYVSEPEDTLMDVMAGTGTLMVGALIGRRIVCIEISKQFCNELMLPALAMLEQYHSDISHYITIINQPCQVVLPLPGIDHIIFSPPYAQIMKSKGTDTLTLEKTDYDMAEYHQGALNIGQLNEFLYLHKMEEVYTKCYASLKPGGTMTVILKDHMKDRQRVAITKPAVDSCTDIGFKLQDWFKWKAPGSVYTHIYRAKGWEVVEDEDIVTLRKP